MRTAQNDLPQAILALFPGSASRWGLRISPRLSAQPTFSTERGSSRGLFMLRCVPPQDLPQDAHLTFKYKRDVKKGFLSPEEQVRVFFLVSHLNFMTDRIPFLIGKFSQTCSPITINRQDPLAHRYPIEIEGKQQVKFAFFSSHIKEVKRNMWDSFNNVILFKPNMSKILCKLLSIDIIYNK